MRQQPDLTTVLVVCKQIIQANRGQTTDGAGTRLYVGFLACRQHGMRVGDAAIAEFNGKFDSLLRASGDAQATAIARRNDEAKRLVVQSPGLLWTYVDTSAAGSRLDD